MLELYHAEPAANSLAQTPRIAGTMYTLADINLFSICGMAVALMFPEGVRQTRPEIHRMAVDFNQDYLREKRAALAGRDDVHFVLADVGDRDQVRRAADAAIDKFGKIHVLCNNAGVGGGGDTHAPDFETWDRTLRINLGAVVNGTKIITPLILSHGEGGHIVNTASMAGIVPLPLPGRHAHTHH